MFGNTEINEQPETQIPDTDMGAQLLQMAGGDEINAHKDLLGQALSHLSGQGMDLNQIAQMAGVGTPDVNALSPAHLVQLTQWVAVNHPEVLQMLAEHFPAAQGLLGLLTGRTPASAGEGASANGGGILGGLLGRVLGGL